VLNATVLHWEPVHLLSAFTDPSLPPVLLRCAFAGAGLLLGSFLNVCIARLPAHRSVVHPGSHCPQCKSPVRAWQNIPLLSYGLLRGRCHSCRQRIPLRYPLVEAALAGLFLLCAWRMPGLLQAAEAAILCFLLLGLLFMDAETMRLPEAFTFPGIALGLLQSLLPDGGLIPALGLTRAAPFAVPTWPAPARGVAGAVLAAGLLYGIRVLYFALRRREGMGLGDIKLAALLGAWLGVAGAALSLMLGILLAASWGAFQIFRSRENFGAARLPLGAFLCAGGLMTLFDGVPILKWYFHFWR
jgi:leader peptidase (prepilin peptidase)/N-methyltransferase